MESINLFSLYVDILNNYDFKYFITGAVASIVYGETRLTHDIDLVISMHRNEAGKFMTAFPSDKFYCPPEEIIIVELDRPLRGHIKVIHHETGFKADFYFTGQDGLQQWGLVNRKVIEFAGSKLYVAPPEYIVIKKLQYFQEGKSQKHIIDISGILENSGDIMDIQFLNEKISELKLEDAWKIVKEEN
jgi:hypothetical protein